VGGRSASIRLVIAAMGLAALTTIAPPRVHAQTTDDASLDLAAEAQVLFELGVEAQRGQHYLEALQYYLASERLSPNANVVFNIAVCFERLQRYTEAFRYYDEYASGADLSPDDRTLVNAALGRVRPRVALLRVESDPAGATVYLDRRDLGARGQTPITLAVDPTSTHAVMLERAGYEGTQSDTLTVSVGAETAVSLALVRILGEVEIRGEPEGASVRIDDPAGEVAGVLPATLSVVPGRHVLYVSAPGHVTSELVVEIGARESITTHTTLAPETGTLVVDADERGALIEIDGEARGFTPAVLGAVTAGHHTVHIRRSGFGDVYEEVDVLANESASVSAHLRIAQEVAAASREVELLEDVPASVSLVSGAELRAFGWQTLAEAVLGLRGIYQTDDRSYVSLGLRGFSQPSDYGNRLLVTMDGHSMNDDQLGSSYVGFDQRADLLDVDRIELVRGPGSALYGTNAFFGVINMVTNERGSVPPLHVSLATLDARMARLRIGGGTQFAPDAGFWASASGILSQGEDLVFPELDPNATVRGADGFNTGTIAARGWWGDFTLEGSLNRRDHRIPTGAFDSVVGDPASHLVDTRGFLELRWEPQIADIVRLHVRGYMDAYFYEDGYAYREDDGMGNVTRSTTRDAWQGIWAGGEARGTITATEWLRFTVGAEGRGSGLARLTSESDVVGGATDRYLDEDYVAQRANVPGAAPGIPRLFSASGYALADLHPWREVGLNAGVRYDYVSTFSDGAFSPRGTLFLRPWDGGTFRVMGGGAFRAPSPYELRYWDGGQTQVQAVTLRPERIWTGELEYTHRIDDVSIIASVFYNRILDLVTTRDASFLDPMMTMANPACASGSCFAYTNSDRVAQTLGAEAEVRRDFRHGWMIAATYSYQRTRFGENPFSDATDTRITNSPEHIASVRGVAPILAEMVNVAARLRVESPRLARRDASAPFVETPVPVLLDLTISGRIADIHLDYALGLRNVFDWRYGLPADNLPMVLVPQAGRTFFVQTTLWY
jgi:outer membrane receptor protein involved in Fe transport